MGTEAKFLSLHFSHVIYNFWQAIKRLETIAIRPLDLTLQSEWLNDKTQSAYMTS